MKVYDLLNVRSEDFVNINLTYQVDTKVFIDPFKIYSNTSEISRRATLAISDYFSTVIEAYQNLSDLRRVIGRLDEIDQLKIGYSKGGRGRGIGNTLREILVTNFYNSTSISSGLLTNMLDVNVFIKYVSNDRVSDWLSHVLLDILVEYTSRKIRNYESSNPDSIIGWTNVEFTKWNTVTHEWELVEYTIPLINGVQVILVPKEFVSPEKLSLKGLRDFTNLGILATIKKNFSRYDLSSILQPGVNINDRTAKKDIANFFNARQQNLYQLGTITWLARTYPNLISDAKNEYYSYRRGTIIRDSVILNSL